MPTLLQKGSFALTEIIKAQNLDELDLDVLDPASFDTMNLVSLIRQLHERLRLLEARIESLEASRMGGRHGGK